MSKKLTLRDILSVELLSVLQTTTESCRVQTVSAERKLSDQDLKDIDQLLGESGWSGDHRARMKRILGIATKTPELMSAGSVFPVMAVITLQVNATSHGYDLNTPHIVVHRDNRLLLHKNGKVNHSTYSISDKPTLATDEQVIECIQNLTDAQWKTIASDPLFAPIMNAALERDIEELTQPKPKKSKGEADRADSDTTKKAA